MSEMNKADIHIHTTFSDGLNDPEAVVNYVGTQTDLRVIAITDHNTLDGARAAYRYWQTHRDTFDQLEVIVGVEVSSAEGHILALFVEEDIPEGMSAADTVTAIHAQGGLAIAAHPFTHLLPFTDFEGIGRAIGRLPLDGIEARSSVPTELYANWMTSAYNRRCQNLPELGSSDAHYLTMIGKTFTWFAGQTAADFRAAVEAGTVRAGGRINGPKILYEVGKHLLDRRQIPFFLPHDDQHRRLGPGLKMQVKSLRTEQAAVLTCIGRLERENADVVKREVTRLLASQFNQLIFDLTALEFIDSTGIGALLSTHKKTKAAGGQMILCGTPLAILRTFKLMRLETVFVMRDSVMNALGALYKHLQKTQTAVYVKENV